MSLLYHPLLEGRGTESSSNEIASTSRHNLQVILIANPYQICFTGFLTPTIDRASRSIRIRLIKRFTERKLIKRRDRINNAKPNIFAPERSNSSSSIKVVCCIIKGINSENRTLETSKTLESVIESESEVLETINNARMILNVRHTESRNHESIRITTGSGINGTHTSHDIV